MKDKDELKPPNAVATNKTVDFDFSVRKTKEGLQWYNMPVLVHDIRPYPADH